MAKHFSSKDLAGLKIEHFIFHIITKGDEGARYLDAVPLEKNQSGFFKEQFKLSARSSVEYQFNDPGNSSTYRDIEELVKKPSKSFVDVSKRLTKSFHSYHRGNVNDGIFIIALVALPEAGRLLFLIKMDYEDVLDFTVKDINHTAQAILKEVTNPIVQSREAIQKVAIIDVGEQYDWDVLASDRATGSKPTVSKYFSDFLQVSPLETDAMWMNKTVQTTLDWAKSNRGELAELPGKYKDKAVSYMKSHPVFRGEDYIETILADEPENVRPSLMASFQNVLEQDGIGAISYVPQIEELSNKPGKLVTKEGVTIEWKGSLESNFIEIQRPAESENGFYQITIKTDDIEFKK